MSRHYLMWVLLGVGLTFCVASFGAYVRLTDAGLGCPDWPGCYGHLVIPLNDHWMTQANEAFPERPVELFKAWVEMIHRHLAKLLGLLMIGLAIWAWRRRHIPEQPVILPWVLLGAVLFQGMLGAWTVTWQLKPLVVMAHLLGGLTILSLLWYLALHGLLQKQPTDLGIRRWAVGGLVVVAVQVALGGWTSANYAALACGDAFPTCQGQWWPAHQNFAEGFVMWRGIGVNYEFGVLDGAARTAIHMAHRVGALIVTAGLLGLAWALWRGRRRGLALMVIGGLVLQLAIGAGLVWMLAPLWLAVAHHAGGAILLLILVTVNFVVHPNGLYHSQTLEWKGQTL